MQSGGSGGCVVVVQSLSHFQLLQSRSHELYSLPGASVQGIFQARILEWIAISFSKSFPSLQPFRNKNWHDFVKWNLSTLSYSAIPPLDMAPRETPAVHIKESVCGSRFQIAKIWKQPARPSLGRVVVLGQILQGSVGQQLRTMRCCCRIVWNGSQQRNEKSKVQKTTTSTVKDDQERKNQDSEL